MDNWIEQVLEHINNGDIDAADRGIFTRKSIDELDRLVDKLKERGMWDALDPKIKKRIAARRKVLEDQESRNTEEAKKDEHAAKLKREHRL